ncbi:Calmodulin binding protein PICBP [Linum grandiflorum]
MSPDKVESGNATDSEFSLNSDTLSVTSDQSSSSSSSSSSKNPNQTPPNYMKTTTSSVAKKTNDSQRSAGKGLANSKFRMRRPDSSSSKIVDNPASDHSSSSDSEGGEAKSGSRRSAVKRTSSSRLTKVASLRFRRQPGRSSVVRSTCSSALRDSKLATKNQDNSNSNEVNASTKVCPYSYCSLHGHHHSSDQVPITLKRFVSMRRRWLKPQKKKTNSSDSRKRNQTKKGVVVSDKSGQSSCVVKANGGSLETDDKSDVFQDKDLVVGDYKSGEDGGNVHLSSENSVEKNKKKMGLWGVIYQHMASGIAADGTDESSHAEKTGEEEEAVEEYGGMDRDNSHQIDAIKLVQEAFDKILSEIPDPLSDNQSVDYSDAGSDASAPISEDPLKKAETLNDSSSQGEKAEPKEGNKSGAKKRVNGWSNLKKIMIMKRFVKAMDNVKKFNLRRPEQREDDQFTEQEKVNLRPQTIGEKKKSEEWMLDYALQKVISTLAPAQKRKVALIVQAFETVAPQGDDHINTAAAASTPNSPIEKDPEPEQNIIFGVVLRKVSTASRNADGTDCDVGGFDLMKSRLKSIDQIDAHQEQEKPNSQDSSVDNVTLAPAARTEEEPPIEIEQVQIQSSNEAENDEELDGDRNAAEPEAQMGKQKHSNLWFLIYKHMVSGTTQPLQEAGEESKSQSQIEAIRLVEEAIDEIPLPETQDDPAVTRHINSQVEEEHNGRTTEQQVEDQKEEARPAAKKSWSNLKKVILLKRFIKSLEKVNDSCLTPSSTKFKEPNFLPLDNGQEADKVQLRRQDVGDRKSGDEWMLDHALRQVVAQLTPVRRRKVELLVEAYETVTPTIRS